MKPCTENLKFAQFFVLFFKCAGLVGRSRQTSYSRELHTRAPETKRELAQAKAWQTASLYLFHGSLQFPPGPSSFVRGPKAHMNISILQSGSKTQYQKSCCVGSLCLRGVWALFVFVIAYWYLLQSPKQNRIGSFRHVLMSSSGIAGCHWSSFSRSAQFGEGFQIIHEPEALEEAPDFRTLC